MSAEFTISTEQRVPLAGHDEAERLRGAVVWAVGRSCLLLDEERFREWVGLFSGDGRYRVVAYSPEIRKQMTWLELDRDGLADLVSKVGFHLRKTGTRTRLATVVAADPDDGEHGGPGHVDSVTRVAMYDTDEKGRTELWAVATYRDRWLVHDGALALGRRDVEMDTRLLEIGSLTPI